MPKFPEKEQLSKLPISKINELVKSFEPDEIIIEILSADSRAGVRAIAQKLVKRKSRIEQQLKRQQELNEIENELYSRGIKLIAGVDEAGRGPLAGPVVAAAVILPEDAQFYGLDDSKKLTAKKREELFDKITNKSTAWGIGMVDNEEIDNTNILDAAMKAMRTAVRNMKMKPDIALVDGNRSPGLNCREHLLIDGDARCRVIAAASVIAKVTRDRIMVELDSIYPGYGFAGHKGYGAEKHVEAIRKMGPCDIHRISFKIVPAVAPRGTVADVMKKRLENAPTREAFDRVVSGIARMKGHLHKHDIEVLREVYLLCSDKMKNNRKITGARGEETSCNYLKKKGYRILERNWRAAHHSYEIDIIAQTVNTIVFCEVKTAGTKEFGPSVSWVTPEKIERLSQAAREYIAKYNITGHTYRFDVIGLQVKGETYEINHIENAFTAPEDI